MSPAPVGHRLARITVLVLICLLAGIAAGGLYLKDNDVEPIHECLDDIEAVASRNYDEHLRLEGAGGAMMTVRTPRYYRDREECFARFGPDHPARAHNRKDLEIGLTRFRSDPQQYYALPEVQESVRVPLYMVR